MQLKDGYVDLSQIVDTTRLAEITLENSQYNLGILEKTVSFIHDAYLADDLNNETINELKTKYDIASLNKPIVVHDTGDVVTLTKVIEGIQQSNNDDIDADILSIEGNSYSTSEVIAELDEQYVSSVCYTGALQTLSNANYLDNRVDSSMYMSSLPQSIKQADCFDQYALYYANIMDMQEYDILQKVQAINNLAILDTTDDTTEFLIDFESTNYTGVSPIIGWITQASINVAQAVDTVISSIKTFKDACLAPFRILGNLFKLAFPSVAKVFKTDVFKKSDRGYQALLDVPFFQFKIPTSKLGGGTFAIPARGSLYITPQDTTISGFLQMCGLTFNDLLGIMGYSRRIEIPLKGVSYFISYDSSDDTFLFQCFVGFVQSHGLDDYINGNKIIPFISNVPPDFPHYVTVQCVSNSEQATLLEQTYRSSLQQNQHLVSFSDLIADFNVIMADYTENADYLYQCLIKACQLACLYPIVLNEVFGNGLDIEHVTQAETKSDYKQAARSIVSGVTNTIFPFIHSVIIFPEDSELQGPYGTLWNEGSSVADASSYGATGLFKELYNNRNATNVTNLTVYNSLNKGINVTWPSSIVANSSWMSYQSIARSIFSLLLSICANYKNRTSWNFQIVPYVSNSLHFPACDTYVCTDADNVSKFSGFMAGLGALIGVVAGGIIVGKVVKRISNYKVTTNALYYNNLQRLAQSTVGSDEYNALLRQGVKLRRRMKRIGDISAATGASVSSLSLDFGSQASDIQRIQKLIAG